MAFAIHPSPVRSYVAEVPTRLPIDAVLALPDYVTSDPGAPIFNLPAAVGRLLGQFGWERASRIIRPWVWAPGWTPEQLERFAATPFSRRPELLAGAPAARLAVIDFPGMGALADLRRPDFPTYAIVQLMARVEWHDGERAVYLSEATGRWVQPAPLREALRAAQARLLILHVPHHQHDDASEIGRLMAAEGIPATIVLSSIEPAAATGYLSDLYANIVHNISLQYASEPGTQSGLVGQPTTDNIRVDLHHAEGGLESLLLGPYLSQLQDQVATTSRRIDEARSRTAAAVTELELRAGPVVHAAQERDIRSRLAEATEQLDRMSGEARRMSDTLVRDISFAHESTGTEPLVRVSDELSELEAVVAEAADLPDRLEAEVGDIIEQSPRVLNANFANPATRAVVAEHEGLVPGETYELLVDIGPRWSTIPSIVRGSAEFPVESLPPDADGYAIDVLVLSDDFEPPLATSRLWVPRSNGRSHPWADGGPSPDSGPVALPVTAPPIANPRARSRRARARLFLYHEQNLVQSAVVDVGVVRGDARLDRPNRIQVDYVLSATLNDVAARFGRRMLAVTGDEASREQPVRVNITLNSDGAGSHRIIVQGRDDLPTAWTAYDPAAARQSLQVARRELVDCFWQRDESSGAVRTDQQGNRVRGLDSTNGKPLNQFLTDLYALAKVGNRLYGEMLHSVRPATDGGTQSEWEDRLRSTLERTSIIQVARIDWTPAQYAFPWALLYEYPLPGTSREWQWCEVVKEWGADGRRSLPAAGACPFAAEAWHRKNVLCPYGFWGLKHIIEQPLGAAPADERRLLRDAVRDVRVAGQVSTSIGWTRDVALDLPSIDRHVERIRQSPRLRLAEPPPNPGDDRATIGTLISRANLVYFLCHCEKAADLNQPYLSVGLRDGNEARRIYATTVTDWARGDLPEWRQLSPIVVINGCHTGDIEPGEVLNFVSAFGLAGAAGVISTDVSVQLPIAIEIGELLVDRLVNRDGGTVGQALREIRWELANKGNLLGLAYGAYGLADMRFVRQTQ